MNGPINFAEINRVALAAFPAVWHASCPGASASARRLSHSIRAARTPIWEASRCGSPARGPAVGLTSLRGIMGAIWFRWSPISKV
jgi:hypothetical protein